MRAKRFGMALTLAALVLLVPRPSHAETLLTPFAGIVFGGDADSSPSYGASITYMGAGIFGVEGEFAYSPSFFDNGDLDFIDSDNVTSLMVNLIVGAPFGTTEDAGAKPYVTGGLGLLRTNVDGGNLFGNVNNNDFGFNLGAGVYGFFSEHAGIRADVRYFRVLTDPNEDLEFDVGVGDLDFWRGSVGVTFRF